MVQAATELGTTDEEEFEDLCSALYGLMNFIHFSTLVVIKHYNITVI